MEDLIKNACWCVELVLEEQTRPELDRRPNQETALERRLWLPPHIRAEDGNGTLDFEETVILMHVYRRALFVRSMCSILGGPKYSGIYVRI